MHHGAIDRFADRSAFREFDARAKIVGTTGFVTGVVLLGNITLLYFALTFIVSLLAISSIPITHILKRFIMALPFVTFASLALLFTGSAENAAAMFLRITTSVLALIFLAGTTPFFELLKGLQGMRVPGIIVTLLMFTYRYIFVFQDELRRMRLARKARGHRTGGHVLDRRAMRTISYTMGMTLVRAYERGTRVYDALRARGFDGNVKTMGHERVRPRDLVACALLFFMPAMLHFYEYKVMV